MPLSPDEHIHLTTAEQENSWRNVRMVNRGHFIRVAVLLLCCLLFLQQGSFARDQQQTGDQQVQKSPSQQENYLTALLSLSDPAKLATLGDRGANPRLKKIVYWLDYARKAGRPVDAVIDDVLTSNGYTSAHAALIKTNLLRNIKIGDELGFFTPENLSRMRRGIAPRVMTGPYAGDEGEVDHIIPFSVAPEIGNDLANLELMPGKLNRKKSGKVGLRQKDLANKLHEAGVINDKVLARILSVKTSVDDAWAVDAQAAASGSPATATPTPSIQTIPVPPVDSSGKVVVWVNTGSHIYHMPGTTWYGKTHEGKYMTEEEAIKAGDQKARNGQ